MNLDAVLAEMLTTIETESRGKWGQVKECSTIFVNSKKDSFQILKDQVETGSISQAKLKLRIKQHEDLLALQLDALGIIQKSETERIAKAAFAVLKTAIETIGGFI